MTITSIYNELSNNINDKYQIISKRKTSIRVESFYWDLISINKTYDVKLTDSLSISLGCEISLRVD